MAAWTITRTGATWWSEVKFPDPPGIMAQAKKHGLMYGATFVTKIDRKRSFLFVARPDRELTDGEMLVLHSKIESWAKLFVKSKVSLTEVELQARITIRDGMRQSGPADKLQISLSFLKARLDSSQKKLGANNTLSAVVMGVRQNLI